MPILAKAIANPELALDQPPKPKAAQVPKPVIAPIDTRAEIAVAAGVSHGTFDKAKIVLASASDAAKDAIRSGKSTINKEYKTIITADRKAVQVEAVKHAALPVGKYSVIVSDPPWRYGARAEDVTHRAANPYPSMEIEAIRAMAVADLAPDCVIRRCAAPSSHGQSFDETGCRR